VTAPTQEAKPDSSDRIIEELAAQIRHHRNAYYNNQPEISDEEFDALEDRLRELAPRHPVLGEVGAPVHPKEEVAVGQATAPLSAAAEHAMPLAREVRATSDGLYLAKTRPTDVLLKDYKKRWAQLSAEVPDHPALAQVVPPEGADWPKARHQIPMGSLNKVNTEDEFSDWCARCDELAGTGKLDPVSPDLMLTEKLDGLSLELVYLDGELDSAITRGDGEVGERITANVRRMRGVPAQIETKGSVSVRGEIVLRKSNLAEFVEERVRMDPGFNRELSLRNTAAGLARAKEARLLPLVRLLNVLCYDVEGVSGLATEVEKMELITELGFDTPTVASGELSAMIATYRRYSDKLREGLDYEIDGLVVRANSIHTSTLLGELNRRPRAAIAFKFVSEAKVSTLRAIGWSTGDSGRITPIAEIEAVRLAGANVRQASLHNWANVQKLRIGVGDQVLVSRRNDVIPYVEKVVVKGPNTASAPATCGRCGAPVVTEGEYLVCRNDQCPARKVGRLKVWIRQLGLLDWGEKTLERLWDEGLVKEPADLYRLTAEKLVELERFGEVSAKRLLDPLLERKKIPLPTFIAALGIETVSLETAKLLVNAGYDSVAAIAGASLEELSSIPGLGAIKAEKIKDGTGSRLAEIERLAEVGVVPVAPKEGGPLAGLSFCFSGAHSRPRKELHALVEKNGGSVATSVTKGVTYLVLAAEDSNSSKAQKARKLGTEIIDEPRFIEILKEKNATL
jgi:DNA ligase (NAD+)